MVAHRSLTRTVTPADPAVDDSDALNLGSQVGPYLILERIATGGMGRVFLGTDPRLRRRVALKCLLDSRATGANIRSRILDEARAAARVSSPHIAAVYDVVEQDARVFIVMEYVEGESLSARLMRGRPGPGARPAQGGRGRTDDPAIAGERDRARDGRCRQRSISDRW